MRRTHCTTFLAAAILALVPPAQADDEQPDWRICPDGRAYALATEGVRIDGEDRAIPTGPADVLGCGPGTLLIGRYDGDRTWVTAFREANGAWQSAGEPVAVRGRALALAGDGVRFAASLDARRGGVLAIYDSDSGRRRTEFTLGAAPPSLALARQGSLLLAATREQIRLYTWPEGLSVEVLEVPGTVLRLHTADTAPHLVAVSLPGSLLVFDLRDARERGALPVRARIEDGARSPAAVRSALAAEELRGGESLASRADSASIPPAEVPAKPPLDPSPEPVPASPSEPAADPSPITAIEEPTDLPPPEDPAPIVEAPPAQPPALDAPAAPETVAPETPAAEPLPAAPVVAEPVPPVSPVEPSPAASVVAEPIPPASRVEPSPAAPVVAEPAPPVSPVEQNPAASGSVGGEPAPVAVATEAPRGPSALPIPDSRAEDETVSPEATVTPRDLVVTLAGRAELVAEIDVRGPDNRMRSFGRFARPDGATSIRVPDLPPGRYTIVAMGAAGASLATVPELADIEKTDNRTARAEIRVLRAR